LPRLARKPPAAAGAPAPVADQASGLRQLMGTAPTACTLVLLPALRSPVLAEALAERARLGAQVDGPLLIIDAARAQVAVALDQKLRYDLDHALAGDCELSDACIAAGPALWVLPAARALDRAMADEAAALRLGGAMAALARGVRQVMIIVPAARAAWLNRLPEALRSAPALIPVAHGGEASAAVLTAVRQGMSEAGIGTFHLLFPGMGEAAARRLLSGMAAIAQRHFGARLLAAPPVTVVAQATAPAGAARRSVETVF